MAKMVLKEFFICSCDDGMFAYKIDKENKKVTYKCLGCDETMEKTFDEVKLSESDTTDYFVLNDDGEVTWKCVEHGYCQFDLEYLWKDDRLQRFCELGCGLCEYSDEIEAGMEAGEDDEIIVKNIIASLNPEQLAQLSENMGVESFDGGDISFETYMDYYNEAMCYEQYEGFWDFIETLKTTIFDLFEIEYDEEGNIFKLGE